MRGVVTIFLILCIYFIICLNYGFFFFEYSDLDMDINKKELREDGSRKGFSHDIRKCSH
jgi:hypothetical protein